MKLIKISSDHYIIVDDSEVKKGEYCYDLETKTIRQWVSHESAYIELRKITHSTRPLNDNPHYAEYGMLSLQEVKELIGEVDVKKMADEYANHQLKGMVDKSSKFECVNDFINGYHQALEDNKDKKYTENDMRKAFKLGQQSMSNHNIPLSFEYNIKFLQPKTEWEVEFIDGKLKLIK